MIDFGTGATPGGATKVEQDETQVKLDTIHTDLATTLAGHQVTIQGKLDAIATAIGAAQPPVIHTLVDAITFNDDPTQYTSDSIDAEGYTDLAVLIDLAIADAPTDIVIRIQESDDDSTFYSIMNGPLGDLRYEDTAGAKTEAIHAKVTAPYLRAYVLTTGTDGTKKFILTLKVVLM